MTGVSFPRDRTYVAGIALPQAVGFAGAFFTKEVVRGKWYTSLKKAPFNPPNWLFPVAWTTLYLMMGIASVLVYQTGNGVSLLNRRALILYLVQLAINGCWSTIFFKWRMPGFSVLWILLLDATLTATTLEFLAVNPTSGYLMLPYLAWCLFATLLNYSVWILNYDSKKAKARA